MRAIISTGSSMGNFMVTPIGELPKNHVNICIALQHSGGGGGVDPNIDRLCTIVAQNVIRY